MTENYRKDPEAVSRLTPAALRFIPAGDLEREGYGAYRQLFEPDEGSSPPA